MIVNGQVTEQRTGAYRALPRAIAARALALQQTGTWVVKYFSTDESTGHLLVACWRCGKPLNGWMPVAKRAVATAPNQTPVTLAPFNHYRETFYTVRLASGLSAHFTALHCADCPMTADQGADALVVNLAGHDLQYMTQRLAGTTAIDPHQWATTWAPFSGATVVGVASGPHGPSKG